MADLKKDDDGNEQTVQLEEACMKESKDSVNRKFGGKQLLGDGRLRVIFANESVDLRKIYKWGIESGNGTPEARENLRKRLEEMAEVDEARQRARLSSSSQHRFVYAEGHARTHNIQFIQPQLITNEVRWVFEGYKHLIIVRQEMITRELRQLLASNCVWGVRKNPHNEKIPGKLLHMIDKKCAK
jgi:hypothetical protein